METSSLKLSDEEPRLHCTNQLSEYMDGRLDSHNAERVRRHLRECMKCQNDLADLATISRLVSDLPTMYSRRTSVTRYMALPHTRVVKRLDGVDAIVLILALLAAVSVVALMCQVLIQFALLVKSPSSFSSSMEQMGYNSRVAAALRDLLIWPLVKLPFACLLLLSAIRALLVDRQPNVIPSYVLRLQRSSVVFAAMLGAVWIGQLVDIRLLNHSGILLTSGSNADALSTANPTNHAGNLLEQAWLALLDPTKTWQLITWARTIQWFGLLLALCIAAILLITLVTRIRSSK